MRECLGSRPLAPSLPGPSQRAGPRPSPSPASFSPPLQASGWGAEGSLPSAWLGQGMTGCWVKNLACC